MLEPWLHIISERKHVLKCECLLERCHSSIKEIDRSGGLGAKS